MIHGKRKGLFGHRQKCPPSLHPTLERAEGALPPVKDGGGGRGGGTLCLKKGVKAGRERDFSTLSPIREPVHRLTSTRFPPLKYFVRGSTCVLQIAN